MQMVSISDAKAQFSKLIERASMGESIIITKTGKPMAKLVPLDDSLSGKSRRFGIMPNIKVPDDFDTMFADEIERMFYGDE